MTTLVTQMLALLGKRSDDPLTLRFHEAEGLPPPPNVFAADLAYPVKHPTQHYALSYSATVRREGYYPPRRENGEYVAYVERIELEPGFDGEVAGVTTKTAEREASARAISTKKNAFAHFYVIDRADGRSVTLLFDSDPPHALTEIRLGLDELDPYDDADVAVLQRLAAAAPRPQPRPRLSADALGAVTRESPPELVHRLAAISADAGFGDGVDLAIDATWATGGPEAWTGNPDAEEYFRVFGRDGSGGMLAFWLVEARKPMGEQPIVFLESEGSLGMVAKNLADLTVLLAEGVGPYELVQYGTCDGTPNRAVRALADSVAITKGRSAKDVIRDANRLYPDFESWMNELRG